MFEIPEQQIKVHCSFDKMIPIDELKPHPDNTNTHDEQQIEHLAYIILHQGIRQNIKVSNRSGFITAGHARLLAMKKIGVKEAPVNFQDYDSEEAEYADLNADNAIAAQAKLDMAAINFKIQQLGPELDTMLLGLRNFEVDMCDLPQMPNGDKLPFVQRTFILSNDQAEQVDRALEISAKMGPMEDALNTNSNGNALARVCEVFITSNGSS